MFGPRGLLGGLAACAFGAMAVLAQDQGGQTQPARPEAEGTQGGAQIGQPIEDFQLKDKEGLDFLISDAQQQDRIIVLHFFDLDAVEDTGTQDQPGTQGQPGTRPQGQQPGTQQQPGNQQPRDQQQGNQQPRDQQQGGQQIGMEEHINRAKEYFRDDRNIYWVGIGVTNFQDGQQGLQDGQQGLQDTQDQPGFEGQPGTRPQGQPQPQGALPGTRPDGQQPGCQLGQTGETCEVGQECRRKLENLPVQYDRVLVDCDGEVARQLGITTLPYAIVLQDEGQVAFLWAEETSGAQLNYLALTLHQIRSGHPVTHPRGANTLPAGHPRGEQGGATEDGGTLTPEDEGEELPREEGDPEVPQTPPEVPEVPENP